MAPLSFVAAPPPPLILFELSIRNNGPDAATSVTVTDTLGSSLISAAIVNELTKGSCDVSDSSLTCALGTLSVGERVTVRFEATARGSSPWTNTASVSGAESDPTPSNNIDGVTFSTASAQATQSSAAVRLTSNLSGNEPTAWITLNGAENAHVPGGRFVVTLPARSGINLLQAQIETRSGDAADWSFDFAGNTSFIPGSFAVESGNVIDASGTTIRFRAVTGQPIAFRYRLR